MDPTRLNWIVDRQPAVEMDLPPDLAHLISTCGEGELVGQLRLVRKGSALHSSVCDAFSAARADDAAPMGWAWLTSMHSVDPVGIAHEARAFLIETKVNATDDSQLWLCHRSGLCRRIATLAALVELLRDAYLLRIELHGWDTTTVRELGSVLDDPALLGLEGTYDTRPCPEIPLSDALMCGNEEEIDDAFSSLMQGGLLLERLERAERVIRAVGTPANDILSVVKKIWGRRPERLRLAEIVSSPVLRPTNRGALRSLGFSGSERPYLETFLAAASLPQAPENPSWKAEDAAPAFIDRIEAALAQASALLSADEMASLRFSLARCSPDDAYVVTAILSRKVVQKGWQIHGPSLPNSAASLDADSNAAPVGKKPPIVFGPMARLWPIVGLFVLTWTAPGPFDEADASYPHDCDVDVKLALQLLRELHEPELVPLLDAFLLRKPDWSFRALDGSETLAAALRASIAPITDDDIGTACEELNKMGKPPAEYVRYSALGKMAFLSQSGSDSALKVIAENATRNSYLALQAAERRGSCRASLSLLNTLYRARRAHDADVCFNAAKLASAWGDAEAKKALPMLERAVERRAKALERM